MTHESSRAVVRPSTTCILQLLPDEISVKVCYAGKQTFKELRRRGLIVGISAAITDITFPRKRRGEEMVKLVFATFSDRTPIVDAVAALNREGLRPANPVELISLGRKVLEGDPKRHIIALGEFVRQGEDERYVYIFGKHDDRDAHLHWGKAIPAHMVCAAVRQGPLL